MLSQSAQRTWENWAVQAGGLTLVDAYEPEGTGQHLAMRSLKHIIWMLGGNKSGKTYTALMRLAYDSLPELDKDGNRTGWLRNPYVRRRIPYGGVNNWVSCWSQAVQRETIQPTFDSILDPYLKSLPKLKEKGAYKWVETPVGVIHFKWQQAEKKSYEGANVHLAILDEPHDKAIYNESTMRLAKTRGYLLVAATLVIDPSDPDIIKKVRYVEWMAERAAEWERDRSQFPEMDVIYADVTENPHVDAEFQINMMAGMSPEEKLVRKTGRTVNVIGNSAFDKDMLLTIENHLINNASEYTPEYGMLEYIENRGDQEVLFVPTVDEFPDTPKSGFIYKIWERPVPEDLFIRPEYFIGVDAATGKSTGDYTCAYVIRGDTGHIVACLHGLLTEIELAKQLYLLGMYYCDSGYQPARLAIEVVSVGSTAQSYLITGNDQLGIPKYGIHRLYYRPANSDLERGLLLLGTEPGWWTSNRTRGFLITSMRQMFLEAQEAIQNHYPCPMPDSAIPYEGRWFIADKNGKYQAVPGKYDDRLMAMAIARICMNQYRRSPQPVTGDANLDLGDDDTYYVSGGKVFVNIDGIFARKRAMKKPPVESMLY